MCDHNEDKGYTWLEFIDHPNYEIYLCECGALVNIRDPKNYNGESWYAMTAKEIAQMLVETAPLRDPERLQEIAERKSEIWREDVREYGLLVREDDLAKEYQRLTREAGNIMCELIGPHWWEL